VFVWSDRSVEAEENGSQICFRAVAGILLELRLNIDDEGGADRREQTGLRTCSVQYRDREGQERTKIKVVFKSSLYFCMYSVSYSIVSRLYMA